MLNFFFPWTWKIQRLLMANKNNDHHTNSLGVRPWTKPLKTVGCVWYVRLEIRIGWE